MAEYSIVTEKEYSTLSLEEKPASIGMVMMVKNEEKRISVSLNSIIGAVDALIIYDTGSIDKTMEIIQKFSEEKKINLYMIQGKFTNFQISRNILLSYAEKVPVKYLLLLDCNDELRGGKSLKKIARNFSDKDSSAFLLCQEWYSGVLDKYYNIRFVKNREGWRYQGVVHEWLKDTKSSTDVPRFPIQKIEEKNGVVLYQDRTKDDDKSFRRFSRDKELLLDEYKKNPKDPRTVFYLAQTCQCLNLHDEALYYSKLRLELQGYDEEIFHSYMRCGRSAMQLNHEWKDILPWFMKALEFSERVEPYVQICVYYRMKALEFDREQEKLQENDKKYIRKQNNYWKLAYMFIHSACDLSYPEHLCLFVDKGMYDYFRWHLMGIIGFYVGKYEEGKSASLKALRCNIDTVENKKILQFYLDREKTEKKGKRR